MSEIGSNFPSVAERVAERDKFDSFMAKHIAKLSDHARPFIGRLPKLEQELFLTRALKAAWEKRDEFKPGAENAGLLVWWDKALRAAADSREFWHQVYQVDVRKIRGVDPGG